METLYVEISNNLQILIEFNEDSFSIFSRESSTPSTSKVIKNLSELQFKLNRVL